MKRLLLLFAACGLIAPAFAEAAEIGTYGTTLIRFSQQSTPGFEKQDLAPATQYLGVNASGLANGNLSLHFYGWGRVDLRDQSNNDGRTDGLVSSAYMRYLFPKANGVIKAGRFMLSEGVAHELMDGLSLAADLPAGFNLSLFGGKPAEIDLDQDPRGDWLAGSRLSYRLSNRAEVGISILHADKSPSLELESGTLKRIENYRQLAGIDIWFSPISALTISGRTSYNIVTSGIAENDYTIAVKPAKNWTLSGSYSQRNMKDLYSGTNLPSLFKPDSADKVSNLGGAVTYSSGKPLALTLDYRHTKRDTYVNTDRYGGEIRLAPEKFISGGMGYHRISSGETAPIGSITPVYDPSYHEIRCWLSRDNGRYSASLDAIGHIYDDKTHPDLNGKATVFEVTASAGFRPVPYLNVSGDVSYGENSLNKSEFKGLVRAEFAISSASTGGSK